MALALAFIHSWSSSWASLPFRLPSTIICPNMSNVLSATPNHSNHSFPLFAYYCNGAASRSIWIIEEDVNFAEKPAPLSLHFRMCVCVSIVRPSVHSIPLFLRGRLSVFCRPSDRPSERATERAAGSVSYLESDLFSHSPQPATSLSLRRRRRRRRRRPTSNLSNYHRERERDGGEDRRTCFLRRWRTD